MGMGMRDELIQFDIQKQSITYAAKRFGIADAETNYAGLYTYNNRDGIELTAFIHPGGHTWPPQQTRLMVDFFKRQMP